MNLKLLVNITLFLTVLSLEAQASVIYTYTGNNFDTFEGSLYDESMSITGFIEVESELAPNLSAALIDVISYSFSDGINTLSNENSTMFLGFPKFTTDENGDIQDWALAVFNDTPLIDFLIGTFGNGQGDIGQIFTCSDISCGTTTTVNGAQLQNKGTWAILQPVPLPGACWLFFSGITGLAIRAAKTKRRATV